MVFKSSLIVCMLLSVVYSAPLYLCEVNKVWGEASYLNSSTCGVVDLKLSPTSFTISGFSSGALLTSTLFTMFNDAIDGVAFNAGAAYANNITDFNYTLTGVKGKPVFFYTGYSDPIVPVATQNETANLFESLGADVKKVWIHDFWHIFPNNVQTNDQYNQPSSCAKPTDNYNGAQNCGYNMALENFKHLYGKEDLPRDINYQDSGTLYAIEQRPYNREGAYLADQGFLYIPNACHNKPCDFHLNFHGCTETIVLYNDTFVRQLGYMEHAAANDIIMLFPQVNQSDWAPYPHCWTSAGKFEQDHPQIRAISEMLWALFEMDLLHLGVPKTENVSNMVKSLPISDQMMEMYAKMDFSTKKVGKEKVDDKAEFKSFEDEFSFLI